MTKKLNELISELKVFIVDIQSDAHNKSNLRPERYNNLTIKMDLETPQEPIVKIAIGISSATFNIRTSEKLDGGLGPDERYVVRWLGKANVLESLRSCWNEALKNKGRSSDD